MIDYFDDLTVAQLSLLVLIEWCTILGLRYSRYFGYYWGDHIVDGVLGWKCLNCDYDVNIMCEAA